MSWFYKLRKDGATVSGSGTIAINDVDVTPGHEPFWMTDNLVVYKGPGDLPTQYNLETQKVDKLSTVQSSMIAAGGGEWQALDGEKIWVSVSREGQRAWVIEHAKQNRDRSIFLNGFPIIEHAIVNFAMVENDHVVWSRFEPREVWGRKSHGTPEKLTDGLFGVPVKVNDEMWVVAMTHTTYKIFEWNSRLGYVIEVGNDQNLNPDALFINGKIEIVANAGNGELRRTSVDLSQPRIPVNGAQPEPKPEDPKPEEPKPMPEQTMMLPPEVHGTFVAVVAKFPHVGGDDDRRAAMRKAVETIRAKHGIRWAWKTEHANGYTSAAKDALVYIPEGPIVEGERAEMFIWDMIDGGSREPKPAHMSEALRRAYVLAPAPKDWLAGEEPKPEPKPEDPKPVPTPVCDCAKVKAEMIAAMADLAARMLQAMDEKVAAVKQPRLKAVVEVDPSSSSLWGKHSHGVRVKLVSEE